MRLRSLLLVLATAAVVAFALLNWEEFNRPTLVNLVWGTATVPLPLALLGLLALAVVAFVASGAAREAHHRRLERDQSRVLQAQRELAERAEASRFTELRQMIDTYQRDARHHEATAASALDQALARSLRDQRVQLEQMHLALASRLGEMEARVDARLARMEPALEATRRPPQALHEPAAAPPLRERAGERRDEPVRPA